VTGRVRAFGRWVPLTAWLPPVAPIPPSLPPRPRVAMAPALPGPLLATGRFVRARRPLVASAAPVASIPATSRTLLGVGASATGLKVGN
jgi:hypothetical protein